MERANYRDDSRPKTSRGSALVEFALVFPLFALLLFAIFEFGHYFFVQETLQWATREGARLAMVGGTLPNGKGGQIGRLASVVQTIDKYASVAVNPENITISIFPVEPNGSSPSGWQGEQDAGNPGDYMRVVTQYTYRFITPLIADLFPNGSNEIKAEATYQNEPF